MAYDIFTVLKYTTSEKTHTAIVLEEGIWNVNRIQPPSVRDSYPTVDAWLATLPGSPTTDQLQVGTKMANEHRELQKAAVKKIVKRFTKPNTWHVPRARLCSLTIAKPLYILIKECNLLESLPIREAYNAFVASLLNHTNKVRTTIPKHIYTLIITMEGIEERIYSLPCTTSDGFLVAKTDILRTYQPLYSLIQDTLVPYMMQKEEERLATKERDRYTQLLSKSVKKHQKMTEEYERKIRAMEQEIQGYQDKLQQVKL